PLLSERPELPLPSWYPVDWKHIRRNFWIVYAHEVIGAIIMTSVSVGIDGYVYYLMGMVSSQLKILGNRLEKLGSEEVLGGNLVEKTETNHLNRNKLKLCIKEHQDIL
ncbi:Odorant receptor 59a, partial [Pseudolycoriella hygida]